MKKTSLTERFQELAGLKPLAEQPKFPYGQDLGSMQANPDKYTDVNPYATDKDDNEWNEKNVVGFIAFLVMVVFALLDLITGYVGKDLVINEFIYDSFTLVVLGCFGIAGLEKFAKK